MIKLFFGKDTFSLKRELEKLILSQKKEGGEINIFENGDAKELSSRLLSSSFFATKRLFIIKNILAKLSEKPEKNLISSLEN